VQQSCTATVGRNSAPHAYVRALANFGLRGSMGRVAACADNAATESFYALLQKNVLELKTWASREELHLAIVHWIERTYLPPPSSASSRETHADRV
jgi:transposase InsO family protein